MVGQRDRQRVPVELPRAERADHEVRPLERLVRGRRLVQAPGLGLEVVDVERVRVDVAVPADDVERVVVEHEALVAAAHAHDQLVLAASRRSSPARPAGGSRAGRTARAPAAGRSGCGSGWASRSRPACGTSARLLRPSSAARGTSSRAGSRRSRRARTGAAEDRLERRRCPRGRRAPRRPRRCGRSRSAPRRACRSQISTSPFHMQQPPAAERVAAGLDGARVGQPVDVRVGDPLLAHDRRELADLGDAARRVAVVEDRLVAARSPRSPSPPRRAGGRSRGTACGAWRGTRPMLW